MRLDPAVAAVRTAVRDGLAPLPAGALVLVACSGGADSTALASAALWLARRRGRRVGVVSVDHGLQPGSGQRADRVARWAAGAGAAPAEARAAVVSGPGGPEAAARRGRYRVLAAAAAEHGAAAVLLGHTRDDQAETVLLRLARGSGARALAGMAPVSGLYRRPLLGLPRSVTERACAAEGLPVWTDPHNADRRYRRARVRHDVLPALEAALGPGVRVALARTAELLRADTEALEAWGTGASGADGGGGAAEEVALGVAELAGLPAAVRRRRLRAAAVAAGARDGELGQVHVAALDRLVTDWHGQGAVALPGRVAGSRRCDMLRFHRESEEVAWTPSTRSSPS